MKLLANDAHAHSRLIINSDEQERAIYFSDWVIVTKSDQLDQKLAYLSSPSAAVNGSVCGPMTTAICSRS